MTNKKNIVAIVPAYNEEETIGGVIDDLQKYDITPIIINDGSTDRTKEIARAKGVGVLSQVINRGQGAAFMTGFSFIKTKFPDCIVTFDSDGQHQAREVGLLCEPIFSHRADVVLGSRFLKENTIPTFKRIVLKVATVYTRYITGLSITDTHNGLRALNMHALHSIVLRQAGMAHASEILDEISRLQLKYVEVPVTVTYSDYARKKGQHLSNSIHILIDLWFK